MEIDASPKKASWDTNYYKKYSERFIVSVFQSKRDYHIQIDPQHITDTSARAKSDYYADANTVSGIEINFDKISFSFATKSTPPEASTLKGKTTYTNFGASIGGNEWLLESSYRKFKGFYDKNTSLYDTSYKPGMPYYQNPSMINEGVKLKFMYFRNHHEFAYKSAYTCVYRQVKMASSFVLSSNLYYNSLRTDSSFAPPLVRKYYDDYDYLNGMRMLGASVGGGGSINFVLWRALFVNLTGLANIESQWRKNHWVNGTLRYLTYGTMSFDLRGAIGINNKNFFLTVSSMNDINVYSSGKLSIVSTFYSGNFNIGYRFKVKPPAWYKRFQASKLYNMF